MQTLIEIYEAHQSPISKRKEKSDLELYQEQKNRKASKMRNKPIVIDKIWFQSTGEGYYYLELKDLYQRGKIQGFKRQIPFPLIVNEVVVGKYVCDFGVLNHDGTIDILDYKSNFTAILPLFELKEALMLALYQVSIKKVGLK